MRRKHLIISVISIIILLFYFVFFNTREKNAWIKLNENISVFDNEMKYEYFGEIFNKKNELNKEILEFKNKFPKWRSNDIDDTEKRIIAIASDKLLKLVQSKTEIIVKNLDRNEIKIMLLDQVLDTLNFFQPSITLNNSNRISAIKENINEEKNLILFEISWNKKVNEIDNEIKKYIILKWNDSETVEKNNTIFRKVGIGEPEIFDIQIINKIHDKERDSKLEKLYYYRFQAIAKGKTKAWDNKNWNISAQGTVGITARYNGEPYFLPETFDAIQLKINEY